MSVLTYLLQVVDHKQTFSLAVWSLMLPLFVRLYRRGSLITQNVALDIENQFRVGESRAHGCIISNVLACNSSPMMMRGNSTGHPNVTLIWFYMCLFFI